MKAPFFLWAPRVVGLILTAFLASFALDSVGKPPTDLAMHLLPALVAGAIVAVAWRRPLAGAVAFLVLAAAYAFTTMRRPDWILAVSGPLAFAALSYFAGWLLLRPRQNP